MVPKKTLIAALAIIPFLNRSPVKASATPENLDTPKKDAPMHKEGADLYGLDKVHCKGLEKLARLRTELNKAKENRTIKDILDIEDEWAGVHWGLEHHLGKKVILEIFNQLPIDKETLFDQEKNTFHLYHNGFHLEIWYRVNYTTVTAKRCSLDKYMHTLGQYKATDKPAVLKDGERSANFFGPSLRQNILNALTLTYFTDKEYGYLAGNGIYYSSSEGGVDLREVLNQIRGNDVELILSEFYQTLHRNLLSKQDVDIEEILKSCEELGRKEHNASKPYGGGGDDVKNVFHLASRIADLQKIDLTDFGWNSVFYGKSGDNEFEIKYSMGEDADQVTIKGGDINLSIRYSVSPTGKPSYDLVGNIPTGLTNQLYSLKPETLSDKPQTHLIQNN